RVLSPRLVLEYAALKAARIRYLLPIEDLLKASGGEEETAAAEPPEGVPAPGPAPAAPAEVSKSLTETWQRVLSALGESDKPLRALVAPARLISFTGDEFRLGFPEKYRVSAEKVGEEERRASLAEAVGAVLGRPVTIRVELEAGAPASDASDGTLFRDMPLVTEIRDRYGGEIVEEKEVTASEEES
ncbi:MAG: hypothetical protein V3W11_00075, partial [bacterium]